MGGGIGLDSQIGQGSTFWFTVRLGLAGLSAAQDEKRRMLSGVRIIVVDGDAAARDALMSQLAALGIIATATGNLDEGLTLMQSAAQSAKPFDVAFIDATSGRPAARLVRAIRSNANTQPVRVVLMGNVLGEQEVKEQGFPSNCRICCARCASRRCSIACPISFATRSRPRAIRAAASPCRNMRSPPRTPGPRSGSQAARSCWPKTIR
jgi:CheY-like chemotaxis protein